MEGAGEGTAYWHKVDMGVPKALADVVEASFASIVVDSSFDPSMAQGVFDRLFVPFYSRFCAWDAMPLTDVKRLVLSTSCTLAVTCSLTNGDEVDAVLDELTVSIAFHGSTIAQLKTTPPSLNHLAKAHEILNAVNQKRPEQQRFLLAQLARTLAWKSPFQPPEDHIQPTLAHLRILAKNCLCSA
jgi:hypothetical protein